MSKKHNSGLGGLVYSTNPELNNYEPEYEKQDTLPKEKQKLKVILDTKQRAGKVVTLIDGFIGNDDDLQILGKQLKTKCGTGGTAKEGNIIIQGNYREKIIAWLKEWGYIMVK